jgi:hypothetical protein
MLIGPHLCDRPAEHFLRAHIKVGLNRNSSHATLQASGPMASWVMTRAHEALVRQVHLFDRERVSVALGVVRARRLLPDPLSLGLRRGARVNT